jgi:hypothetical protein
VGLLFAATVMASFFGAGSNPGGRSDFFRTFRDYPGILQLD